MSNETGVNVNKIPVWKKLAKAGKGRSKGQQGLKAERVQLAAERVQELLSGMPGWGLTATGQAIGREWRFPQPRVAAAYAAYVAGLAAAEGQTVQIVLSGASMTLILTSRLRGGSRDSLTDKDFRFATRLG